jgi:hypothetical protein
MENIMPTAILRKPRALRPLPVSTAKVRNDAIDENPANSCYDRLVVQIATLECVRAALSEWDLSGRPTDQTCRIGSAELVLLQSIEALHDITGDVCDVQSLIEKVGEVHS